MLMAIFQALIEWVNILWWIGLSCPQRGFQISKFTWSLQLKSITSKFTWSSLIFLIFISFFLHVSQIQICGFSSVEFSMNNWGLLPKIVWNKEISSIYFTIFSRFSQSNNGRHWLAELEKSITKTWKIAIVQS
jgi:hypothetical protein